MAALIKCDERPFKGGVWGGKVWGGLCLPSQKSGGLGGSAPQPKTKTKMIKVFTDKSIRAFFMDIVEYVNLLSSTVNPLGVPNLQHTPELLNTPELPRDSQYSLTASNNYEIN